MRGKDPCPCRSGATYLDCCRPAHASGRAPTTTGALVRARYSAFALGDGAFLHATLATDHPDRAQGEGAEAARIAELSRAGRGLKYMGVVVLDEREREALFLAKVFERGQDRSFVELSTFTLEDGALRYASGVLLPRAALPRQAQDGKGLRRETFLELVHHPDAVVT